MTQTEPFDLEKHMERQEAALSLIVEEVIKEVFHSIEKPREFELANGLKCKLKTFYEPKEHEGEWSFGLDVLIEDYGIDYIEFILKHTGQGGMVS